MNSMLTKLIIIIDFVAKNIIIQQIITFSNYLLNKYIFSRTKYYNIRNKKLTLWLHILYV